MFKKISLPAKLLSLGIFLIIIDQIIKFLVKCNMPLGGHFNVISHYFQIFFVENPGMAYGMAFGGDIGKILLSLFRIIFSALLIFWIWRLANKGYKDKKTQEYRECPKLVLYALTVITAGAIGNLIDCMFYGLIFSESTYYEVAKLGGHYAPFMMGKVVDMLYFPLIDTDLPKFIPFYGGEHFIFFQPVFNFADSCVTVGAIYLILFQRKFFAKL